MAISNVWPPPKWGIHKGMYIGIGTLVFILLIIMIIYFVRRV
jgi:hypothetical protein